MRRPRQNTNREQLLLRVLDNEPVVSLHASRPAGRGVLKPDPGVLNGFAGHGELFQEPQNRELFSKRLGECIAAFVLFAVTLSWLLA